MNLTLEAVHLYILHYLNTSLTIIYSALQQHVSAILDTVGLNVRIPHPKLTTCSICSVLIELVLT